MHTPITSRGIRGGGVGRFPDLTYFVCYLSVEDEWGILVVIFYFIMWMVCSLLNAGVPVLRIQHHVLHLLQGGDNQVQGSLIKLTTFVMFFECICRVDNYTEKFTTH